ncbi:cupin domain-containing protein [Cyanobacterium aponinum UTEX 3221]|uniref:cupin domain-containing protein n=1 Tax=Cyanobacterium aponinum TaxID=379064 RepID=UPI002B4BC74C|nr:cupin domain-containing protein [Cyanobacterium aponinum]WRL38705.1 cupin domain-containing protein [Cyanobacterium aponinum UTEX 3221]
MTKNAQYWIDKLDLQKHPEGGYYRENYRCLDMVNNDNFLSKYNGARNASTAIYYLLLNDEFSAFHLLKSDEIFHFYSGSSLDVHIINSQGDYQLIKLGNNPEENEVLQLVIPQNSWFAAAVSQPNSYSLIGCTVAPGFDFNDFTLGKKEDLLKIFPQHQTIIERFTYD